MIRTRSGARLVQADATLSRVRDRPGPTQGLFDVLAATVATAAPGPRFLMLGFAAGGMVAPLRALGWNEPIEAVDRSPVGVGLFRRLCGSWAGDVEIHRADALEFLRRSRRRWDVILDDLSVLGPEGVDKPSPCYAELPPRIGSRLRPGGLAIANLLPPGEMGWAEALRRLGAGHAESRLITVDSYENRVLIAGEMLPPARVLSRRLRQALEDVGSLLASEISVRSVSP